LISVTKDLTFSVLDLSSGSASSILASSRLERYRLLSASQDTTMDVIVSEPVLVHHERHDVEHLNIVYIAIASWSAIFLLDLRFVV
jgi:hypothetical protein